MQNYIEFDEQKDALKNYLLHRLVNMRQGFVMCITGSPFTKVGNGKTMTAARLCELIDEDYRKPPYADKFTVLPSEFTEQIRKAGKTGRPEVIVMDEAEIGASSREWMDVKNKAVANALNTFRERGCIAIIIAPLFSDIDKRIRKLVSIWMYPELYLKSESKHVRLKVYRIRTDIFGEDIRLAKLKFFDRTRRRTVCANYFRIELPGKELKKAVEEKITAFKDKIMENAAVDSFHAEAKLHLRDPVAEKEREMSALLDRALGNELIIESLKKFGKVDRDIVSYAVPTARSCAAAIASAINLKQRVISFEPTATAIPSAAVNDR